MKGILFYLPTFIVLAITAVILFTGKALAYDVPSFPSCLNPNGLTIAASYDSGTHGIIGDYSVHTGKDTVYTISDTTVMQCYCDENNNGIQTNWWKVGDMPQDEIDSLEKDGWIFTPNGADWGLDQAPYLAKNTTFDCTACVSPTVTLTETPSPIESGPTPTATPSASVSPTPTLQPTLTPTPEAGSSGQVQSVAVTSNTQPTSTPQQPQVLSASTLAYTGDSLPLVISLLGTIMSITSGFLLKRRLA